MRTKLSLLLVSALLVGSAGGRAYGAVVVEKQSFKGSRADTFFSGSATIACAGGGFGTLSMFGMLTGAQTITKTTGSPKTVTNGASIEIDNYSNTCTGVTFGFVFGGFANGFTPPNAHLNSAQLLGTGSVQDFDSGATIQVAVDVVWEGTGPISAEKSHTVTKTKGPFTITIARQANANRAADASGTIQVDGVDINATFNTSTLSNNANGTLTVTKN
jgi:hypothetical protein